LSGTSEEPSSYYQINYSLTSKKIINNKNHFHKIPLKSPEFLGEVVFKTRRDQLFDRRP